LFPSGGGTGAVRAGRHQSRLQPTIDSNVRRDVVAKLSDALRDNQDWEGPYVSAFIEFKNVHGFKINFEVFDLNDGHVRYWRNVYTGRRDLAPLAFLERQHQMVGPMFTLTLSRSF